MLVYQRVDDTCTDLQWEKKIVVGVSIPLEAHFNCPAQWLTAVQISQDTCPVGSLSTGLSTVTLDVTHYFRSDLDASTK